MIPFPNNVTDVWGLNLGKAFLHFYSLFQSLDWLGRRGSWWTTQQRSFSSISCRRPLWAVLAWAGMSTFWCCPSSISSADHGIAHPARCPEGWFWRGCRGVWHVRIMQVSFSWQLPEAVPVDPQGSWSCSAPSRWSCVPSRRFGARICKQGPCSRALGEDGGQNLK